MISEINKNFLKVWKDFPGSNNMKFLFVIIGLIVDLELVFKDFNFFISWLLEIYNANEGVFGLSFVFLFLIGFLACGILWFPSYLWENIKILKKKL